MILNLEQTLLYIEPKESPSNEPVIDEITKKMTAAFRKYTQTGGLHCDGAFTPGGAFRGWHSCCDKGSSSNCDYMLPNGMVKNSLAMHYLAYHRSEIPELVITIIKEFQYGEEVPTEDELKGKVWK